MELVFQSSEADYLRQTICQIQNQEETSETVVPDSLPDIGRIIGCWGFPVLRSKEWRTRGLTVSGGITASVLYVPESEEAPQRLEVYIPFSIKWDFPTEEQDEHSVVELRLRSMDARLLNPRKILIRAGLSAKGEIYQADHAPFYMLPVPPKDLELKTEQYKLLLPAEVGEKSFPVDEDLELPINCPPAEKLVYYSMQPEITDQKVLGHKAVFKGNIGLHLLYLTPENQLATWDFDIPFSQYTELDREYEQDTEFQAFLCPTGMELEISPDGHMLRLQGSMLAQYLVLSRSTQELIRDAYSLQYAVTPTYQSQALHSRLDRQHIRQGFQAAVPVGVSAMADASFLPDFPRQEHQGDQLRILMPYCASAVYYDESGQLQGKTVHSEAAGETELAEHCSSQANCVQEGRLQWSVGGGSAELRGTLGVTIDSYAETPLEMICALETGASLEKNPERPSLIIRPAGEDGELWDIARRCGSTVRAIQEANHISNAYTDPDKLILIPVL